MSEYLPGARSNAASLAAELKEEIGKAEADWHQIEADFQKWAFSGLAGGLATGATLLKDGNALFMATAAVGTLGSGIWYYTKKRQYKAKYPAAFFLSIKD